MQYTKKETLRNMIMIILGSAVYSFGFMLFLEPSGINCGGISGVSMLIAHVVDHPWASIAVLNMLINIPLFLVGFQKIGKFFFFGSLLGLSVSSALFEVFEALLPTVHTEPLVACIFGSVTIGAGLGIVFLAGASTGGVDIIARLLKLKLRNCPIGKLVLCFDMCTAVATGLVYRELNNTLYSAVALYLSSMVLDRVIYSMDFSKVAIIITDRYDEIAAAIDTDLDRGVTLLQGQGFYRRENKFVLLSAVKRQQLAQLKELVYGIDPNAFVILQTAQQVLGDGFKRYDRFEL